MDQKLLDNGLAIAILVVIIGVVVKVVIPAIRENNKANIAERQQAQQQNIDTLKEIANNARLDVKIAQDNFLSALRERDLRAATEHKQTTEVLSGLTDVVKELKDKQL